MNSPPQLVIKSTFLEFRDEDAETGYVSDEEAFMLPRRCSKRYKTDSIIECARTNSDFSDSEAALSDCGGADEMSATTSCASQSPSLDCSHTEDELEAVSYCTDTEDELESVPYCTVPSANPCFPMPQPNNGYALCYMPGTAFVPMVAGPNGWAMQLPMMQTMPSTQNAADEMSNAKELALAAAQAQAHAARLNKAAQDATMKANSWRSKHQQEGEFDAQYLHGQPLGKPEPHGNVAREIILKVQLDTGDGFIETALASCTVAELKKGFKQHLGQKSCIKDLLFNEQLLEDWQTLEGCGLPDSAMLQATLGDVLLTTLMLRNLPNDYSREDALELLDSQGFEGVYDFFYLPVDFDRGSGMGYAFVNFVSHDHAARAKAHLEGFREWTVASQKVCEVCWGDQEQGREAHEERYRNSPVMHESVPDHFKPVVFNNGVHAKFLAPTKRIRAPRRKPGVRHNQSRW